MSTIDDTTKINLFAVLIALPVLVGGILWLTAIDSKASAAQDELKTTRQLIEYYQHRLDSIDNRLSHIEGKLNQ